MGYSVAPSSVVEITTDKITFFRDFDNDYLHEHYFVLDKSMNQIAKEKGCVQSTVRAAFLKFGFQTKDRKELHCNLAELRTSSHQESNESMWQPNYLQDS